MIILQDNIFLQYWLQFWPSTKPENIFKIFASSCVWRCECVSFCKLNVPIWVRMCLRVCKRACKATVLSPKSCFTWHRQSCNSVGNMKMENVKILTKVLSIIANVLCLKILFWCHIWRYKSAKNVKYYVNFPLPFLLQDISFARSLSIYWADKM